MAFYKWTRVISSGCDSPSIWRYRYRVNLTGRRLKHWREYHVSKICILNTNVCVIAAVTRRSNTSLKCFRYSIHAIPLGRTGGTKQLFSPCLLQGLLTRRASHPSGNAIYYTGSAPLGYIGTRKIIQHKPGAPADRHRLQKRRSRAFCGSLNTTRTSATR
jgi:hypothetical protein